MLPSSPNSPANHGSTPTLHHAENVWKCTRSGLDWFSFKSLCNQYHKLILSSKKEYYFRLVSSVSDNVKRQTAAPQILLTTTYHFSWHFTWRQLRFFFHRQNIQTLSFSHQPPCHIISALTLSSCHSLISQFSLLHWSPKFTRFCQTVQTSNLIQILSPPGFSKNVHLCSFLQAPTLSTSLSFLVSFIPCSRNLSFLHCSRNQLWIKTSSLTTGQSGIFLSYLKQRTAAMAAKRHAPTNGSSQGTYRFTISTLEHSVLVELLDYCSSVFSGISVQLSQRLQSVFNAAACLVFFARKLEHIIPLLCELHWLKAPERI